MKANPKPLSYSNLTSSKLLFPLFYRESVSTTKNFCSSVRTTKRLNKQVLPNLNFFQLSENPIKKGSTKNTIINPVRNGQISDCSFGSFRRPVEVKVKNMQNIVFWRS